MSRTPIRLRLTLAFALAMAVVLVATGAFLYLRLGASLAEAVDESLEARASEVGPRLALGGGTVVGPGMGSGLVDPDERFLQVLDLRGRVVDATTTVEEQPLLDPDAVARAATRPTTWLERDGIPGIAGRARLLATPIEGRNGTLVLIVGASLEDRDETLRGFLVVLFLVGPAALLLTSFLGYALATAALRPVEAMQVEAAAISGSEPGRRLPLPRSQDEIHRLGETLNEMLGRLESALERERGLVADAGHELRTPLALLKTELELALRHPRTAPELEAAIRSAAVETDRLAQLAEDLLLIARSDQGQLSLRRQQLRAVDLLKRVAERFSTRAEASGRVLDVEAPSDIELDADSSRLEQALGNLVENALEHARGPVRLTAAARDGRLELHVTDEGDGFPSEFLPRAFDRFSRSDDARFGDGTGLGLTIADAIAKAHGGSAHAANRESGGADVWVSIPNEQARRLL
ncbi:MAG: HAMP domain-containing protein [Actinobacteria bacterium]|nr:HAMP domain-containing protein [Actinomycetota bacterium]